MFVFFFFKQNTAYEMRISDWSSDVCSSDLKMDAKTAEALLDRIEPVADYAPLAAADLVIEAATEREDIKRAIFGEVGKVLGPQAILASNTSSIPITRLAQAAPDAERFEGVHFFHPVPVMGLIERSEERRYG